MAEPIVEFPAERGPTPTEVVAFWNAQPRLVKCRSTSVNRDRVIRTWNTQNPSWVRHWRVVIEFLGRSPNHTGGGQSKWVATLGWLFERDNFSKAVDQALADTSSAAGSDSAKARFLAAVAAEKAARADPKSGAGGEAA